MRPQSVLGAFLALFVAVGAFAQDTPEPGAQVKTEAAQARKAGQLPVGDLDMAPADISARSSKTAASSNDLTRAEVKAETNQAKREGDVQIDELAKDQTEKDSARYAGAPEKAPKLHLQHRSKDAAAFIAA